MTADQVNTVVSNKLLSPDTCAIQPLSTSTPQGGEDLRCDRDKGVDNFNINIEPILSPSDSFTQDTVTEPISDTQVLIQTPDLPVLMALHSNDMADSVTDSNFDPHVLIKTPQILATEDNQIDRKGDTTEDNVTDSNFDADVLIQVPQNLVTEGDMEEENVTDSICDTHVLIQMSQKAVTEARQISEKFDMTLSESGHSGAPVVVGDFSDCCTGTEGVSLIPTDAKTDCDVSNELWLDACQFLAGEWDEGSILDEWGHSPTTRPTSTPPENTKGSSFPGAVDVAIGHCADDSALWMPLVERWSSTDSWASALSDWAQAVTVHPEDFHAAGTQPQTSMAVQDQTVEQRHSPESPAHTGHMCLSTTKPKEPGMHNAHLSELGDKQMAEDYCSPPHTDTESKLPPHCGAGSSTTPCELHITETVLASGHCADTGSSVTDEITVEGNELEIETVMDICHERKTSMLRANEDRAGQSECHNVSRDIQNPESDAFWEVTEDKVSLPALHIEEEGERSCGSVRISGYPSSQTSAVGCVCVHAVERGHTTERLNLSAELRLTTHTPQENTHVPGDTGHLTHTHTHGAHAEERGSHGCSSAEGNQSYVCSYTQDPYVTQHTEEKTEAPSFIMPFAPLALGSSFLHFPDHSLDGVQACGKDLLNEDKRESWAHIQGNATSPVDLHATNQQTPLKLPRRGIIAESEVNLKYWEKQLLINSSGSSSDYSSDEQAHKVDICSGKNPDQDSLKSSFCGDSNKPLSLDFKIEADTHKASELSKELSKLIILSGDHFMVSEKDRIAYITLDLDDTPNSNDRTAVEHEKGVSIVSSLKYAKSDIYRTNCVTEHNKDLKMPHKTTKVSSECKTRSKHKDKSAGHQSAPQTSKTQENIRPESQVKSGSLTGDGDGEEGSVTVIETIVITEKITTKSHVKKKKKHPQNATVKLEAEPLTEVENCAKLKGKVDKVDTFEAKLAQKTGKNKEKPAAALPSKNGSVHSGITQKACAEKMVSGAAKGIGATVEKSPGAPGPRNTCSLSKLDDDIIKRRRLSGDKFGAAESKPQPLESSTQVKKDGETTRKKAYSEVVKQKPHTQKEAPRVVQSIQAAPVQDDPESISLWCQFGSVSGDSSITWTKEGLVLSETKRGAGDDGHLSLTISKACSKDLGIYQCRLSCSHGSLVTDYHLTSEVLSELVIPNHDKTVEAAVVDGEEEDVRCAPLLFKDDFLCEQYFGENQPASIVTEKDHFGEGMHRRAFRATLRAGMRPVFTPGHPCVLKVHNTISYGTKNNDELVQKNYNLAVEECHVQNTAREYIKAYNDEAKSAEAFGEVPEIIPIYLVHRPSSDIPYATLEEELMGDFVKYSVKDGKEINLMRRESEAGQKCCAFQHWVYHKTEGNLLITDMQGVGMKLTDVGIATCKKGYKGFRGNCATSFIDQFKALHQCNTFCELLGLNSLQPKPRRTAPTSKPKTQPVPKKKTLFPTLKGKS